MFISVCLCICLSIYWIISLSLYLPLSPSFSFSLPLPPSLSLSLSLWHFFIFLILFMSIYLFLPVHYSCCRFLFSSRAICLLSVPPSNHSVFNKRSYLLIHSSLSPVIFFPRFSHPWSQLPNTFLHLYIHNHVHDLREFFSDILLSALGDKKWKVMLKLISKDRYI